MDYPIAPHRVRKQEQKQGEDVVVYEGGIKNVHQDFVIVFAITFAVIVVLIVSIVIIFHTIKKIKGYLNSRRKNVPNICVTTDDKTLIYQRQSVPSSPVKSTDLYSTIGGCETLNEIRSDTSSSLSSHVRRKNFAENRSKTSYASSHLNSIEEGEVCTSCNSRTGSGNIRKGSGAESSSKDLTKWLGSNEIQQSPRSSKKSLDSRGFGGSDKSCLHRAAKDPASLHLPLVSSHNQTRRHTCTLEPRGASLRVNMAAIGKQQSCQY